MSNKGKMTFAEVERNPILATDKIDEVTTYFGPLAVHTSPFAEYFPLVNRNVDKVTIEYAIPLIGGMTKAVTMEATTPIVGRTPGRMKRDFDAVEWREKCIITESELYDFRKIGTMDEVLVAQDLLRMKQKDLEDRLLHRLDWMRRAVLFDGEVTIPYSNGDSETVQYYHPTELEFTASPPWSDPTATPLEDLLLWIEQFEIFSNYRVKRIHMPFGLQRILLSNERFVDTAINSYVGFNGSPMALQAMFRTWLGDVEIVNTTNHEPFVSRLLATANAAATSIILEDVEELSVGKEIQIGSISVYGQMISRTVTAIAGNQVTVNAALGQDFLAGSPVKWKEWSMPLDKILMVGAQDMAGSTVGLEPGVSPNRLTTLGEMTSTLSGYANLYDRRPGLFVKNRDMLDGDPPHIERVVGIKVLPQLHRNDAFAIATVL